MCVHLNVLVRVCVCVHGLVGVCECVLSFSLWCLLVPVCQLLGNLCTQGAAAVGVPELC